MYNTYALLKIGGIILNHSIKKKIRVSKILSICIPLIVAILLSFGNDYIMTKSIKSADSINITTLEEWLLLSNVCLLLGLTFSIFISNFLFRIIIRQELVTPLQRLRDGMSHMRHGDYEYRISYDENDQLFEIYDDFNVMATEMRRFAVKANTVDEGRKRLLLGISHDLRSPLTSIIAYVQGLLDGIAKNEEKRLDYLETIKSKSLEIERMVNRLFTFAKLDNEEYSLHLTEFSARSLLTEYLHSVKSEFAQQNMMLSLHTISDASIMVDPELFKNVCRNIIENSVKYNDKETATLNISLKAGKKYMKITFSDNGPGVDSKDLSHLWDLFFRTDSSRKNPGQSNGIGLAIVKKTIELMDGSVAAKNGKTSGLQIIIRLPIAHPYDDQIINL